MASAHIVAGPAAGPAPRARRRPGGRWLTANLLFGAADPVALVDLVRTHRVDVLTLQ